MKYINLLQIVKQTHESKLEEYVTNKNDDNKDEAKYYDKLKELYDRDSARLREVMISVNFYPELLKEGGEYIFPREDGEFIQWILENYTSEDMKYLRKGSFNKVDIDFLFKILNGFETILKHLDVDENIRALTHQLVNQVTNCDERVRMFNIQFKQMELIRDISQVFRMPTFGLTYNDKMECLEKIDALTEKYTADAGKIYSDIIKRRRAERIKNSYPITAEELTFSKRRNLINYELRTNKEFCRLQDELNELKYNNKFNVQNEKARIKIVKRVSEIKLDILKHHPLDNVEIEKMTKLEKIMLLTDEPFEVFNDSETGKWYVNFGEDVSWWLDKYDSFILG